jgi:CBS-domain-containing membrane protein
MISTTKPILELTAGDLMSREVVTIPWGVSLRAAAHELALAHISGAPVTDDHGRCVGVLSATDLVRWLDRDERAARPHGPGARDFYFDWGVMDWQGLPLDAVRHYMTIDVVRAAVDTPVTKLARWMVDAHIHRVVVTDERDRPIGVVSTTDLLAALAAEGAREAAEKP